MKDDFKIFVFLFLIIGLASVGYFWKKEDKTMKKNEDNNELVDGGVVKDGRLPGYSEKINSKNIIKFEYNGDFKVSCELMDNVLHVTAKGGNSYNRDGTYFKLDYVAKDKNLLVYLQNIIDRYDISKNNGYEHETAGLPAGLGDSISVLYETNEKIWKYSNQSPTISEEAKEAIYDAFKNNARENNLDFTSDGSNTTLYDDATIEYLQGTWKGTHFGREYTVTFNNENVTIYEDNNLIDNVVYKIVEGRIVQNKLKEGKTNSKDYHDYEEFSVISIMAKKNDFTLTAYFMKNSYSTCDLIKQK